MVELFEKKKPVNNYSKNILKTLVGSDRANTAFNSISMATIPDGLGSNGQKKQISVGCKSFLI